MLSLAAGRALADQGLPSTRVHWRTNDLAHAASRGAQAILAHPGASDDLNTLTSSKRMALGRMAAGR